MPFAENQGTKLYWDEAGQGGGKYSTAEMMSQSDALMEQRHEWLHAIHYRLTHSKQYLAERFQAADDEVEEHPRYNIAPTQPVLIVRKEQGKKIRHFTNMRWGLIPSWAKDMSIGTRTLNARSETVTKMPAFRESILTKKTTLAIDKVGGSSNRRMERLW